MKKLVALSLSLLILAACGSNNRRTVPYDQHTTRSTPNMVKPYSHNIARAAKNVGRIFRR
ncbi:MAG: hypothetical protein FWD33_04035 [Alphaproteobacteria bacterium]|nr:hypothetical protein [Alphaproteobacteria bacterium]